MTLTHLIIGAGNMGGAVFSSWITKGVISANQIAIMDPNPGKAAQEAISQGATHFAPDADIPNTIEVAMLGIKPQLYNKIGPDLASRMPDQTLILSIMAGISLTSLETMFQGRPVVRAMPNMPASLSKGMTGYVASNTATPAQINHVEDCLKASGGVLQVGSDDDIDSVTAVSGSGPAYIFHMCEAMSEAGQKMGLTKTMADQLARQTIIGAAAQLETSQETAGALREAVTSPNGTTQAALNVLMSDNGLRKLMGEALMAAKRRAGELSQ